MKLIRILLVTLLALGLGAGIATFLEGKAEAQWGYTWPLGRLSDVTLTSPADGAALVYSSGSSVWVDGGVLAGIASGSGTANTVAKFNASAELADSTITDDATDVTATAGSLYVGAAASANTVQITNNAMGLSFNGIVFEGPSADEHEQFILGTDATVGDQGFYLPDQAEARNVYLMYSTANNAYQARNAVWGQSGRYVIEGDTADDYEANIIGGDFLGGADVNVSINLPAAGAAGNIFSISTTIAAMDAGSDEVNGLLLDFGYTAIHAGGVFSALRIDSITGDADATESAITIETGFDYDVYGTSALKFLAGTSIQATVGANNFFGFYDAVGGAFAGFWSPSSALATEYLLNVGLNEPITAFDGSDTYSVVHIDVTNANHAGTGNTLNMLNIDAIAGDAESNLNAINIGALTGTAGSDSETENAIKIAAGWDSALWIDDGSPTDDRILFGNGQDADLFWDNSANRLEVASPGFELTLGGVGNLFYVTHNSEPIFQTNGKPGAGNSGTIVSAGLGISINGIDGTADVVTILDVDFTNTTSHSAAGNINAIGVDGITGDAEGIENIFWLGDGFDYFINDEVDTALGTLTWTTNADKTALAKPGTLKVFINGTVYHIQLYADS